MDLQSYVGRKEIQHDVADPLRMDGLAALLDHQVPPWKPGVLPPLGHWLCFSPRVRQSLLGIDGHPQRTESGLLPAADLPRRMWAGSRIQFLADIPLGTSMVRTSTVMGATSKTGRTGSMLFVAIRHEVAPVGGETAIIDETDIVFREAAVPGVPAVRTLADPGDNDAVVRTVSPDPIMLFRYSAMTFNGHRIHYDRDYSRNVEAYPGLVVHGPLIATLMLDHLLRHRPQASITAYSFRGISPIFDGEPLRLGFNETPEGVTLRAVGPAGPAMTATASYVP